jgi:adenylate kinase
MKIVFIGPPGAGKGTQALQLCETLKIPHIATGDILRQAVRDETELGLKAKSFMDQGQLVPDEVIVGLIADRISCSPQGFLLDGYPRNASQYEALKKCLAQNGIALDKVICIDLNDEIILRRSEDRRLCRGCSAIYNISSLPPQVEGICDKCQGELYQRDDDKRETMKGRLAVYRQETRPLLEEFRKEGILAEVDGNGTLETVQRRILQTLGREQAE